MERRRLGFHGISWDFMGLLIFWVDLDSFFVGSSGWNMLGFGHFFMIGWFLGGGFG